MSYTQNDVREEINKSTIRINTRVNQETVEWLDNVKKRTGFSKSTLIMLAIKFAKENGIFEEKDTLSFTEKIDKTNLENRIERIERELNIK